MEPRKSSFEFGTLKTELSAPQSTLRGLGDPDPNAQITKAGGEAVTSPRNGVEEPWVSTREPGDKLGPYVIESLCGVGGFGAVYRARHVRTEQLVALKVLHPFLAVSQKMIRRFKREATVLARLHHENIVRFLDVAQTPEGGPYLVMEWVEGITLARHLAESGPLTAEELAPIVLQLCDALAKAHGCAVIHRDLKAENVIISPTQGGTQVRLVDFGISKFQEEGTDGGITTSGTSLGTLNYMAPEQLLRSPLTFACDVYALGVLMHYALSARFPFQAANAVGIISQHLYNPTPRVRDRVNVSARLDDLIARCLRKDPHERPDLAEIAETLRCETRRANRWTNRAKQAEESHFVLLTRVEAGIDDPDEEEIDMLEDMLDTVLESLSGLGFNIVDDSGTDILATRRVERSAAHGLYRDIQNACEELQEQSSLKVSFVLHCAASDSAEAVDALWAGVLNCGERPESGPLVTSESARRMVSP